MRASSLRWRTFWLALGWSIAAGIAWLSLTSSPPTLEVTLGDKIGHLGGYATLMFWFCQIYRSRRARLAYALGFSAMGIALEFLQDATGYRTFELPDMAANALGVLLGWAGAQLVGSEWLARWEAALTRRGRT
jgi:VanZ family protein